MNYFHSLSLFCLLALTSILHAQSPSTEYGVKAKLLTLSDGKYDEYFSEDSILQIGTVLFNTNTDKIVAFIRQDTSYSEATLKPEVSSRWLSPDPLAAKYPYCSPYNFALNDPILYLDPDGRDVFIAGSNPQAFQTLLTTIFDDKVKIVLTANSGQLLLVQKPGTAPLSESQRKLYDYLVGITQNHQLQLTINSDLGNGGKTYLDDFFSKTIYPETFANLKVNSSDYGQITAIHHFFEEQIIGQANKHKFSLTNPETGISSTDEAGLYDFSHNKAIEAGSTQFGISWTKSVGNSDYTVFDFDVLDKDGNYSYTMRVDYTGDIPKLSEWSRQNPGEKSFLQQGANESNEEYKTRTTNYFTDHLEMK